MEVYPYNSNTPVQAVCLRAADHAQLKVDASPSQRYMNILIEGAIELGLNKDYVNMLKSVPTEQVNPLIKFLGFHYFFFGRISVQN